MEEWKKIMLATLIIIVAFVIIILVEAVTTRMLKTKDIKTKRKNFWSQYAGIYDRFMRKDTSAYKQMYALISQSVKGQYVLELATGTGLIAKNIVRDVKAIEATDASPEMIEEAKKDCSSSKLHFSVQNIFELPYADASFPAVIAANVLHIIPEPEKALTEIKRVLTDDGMLIAPTFTHGDMGLFAHIKAGIMKIAGFPLNHVWSPESYMQFLKNNGFDICRHEVLKASFPLTYIECKKRKD